MFINVQLEYDAIVMFIICTARSKGLVRPQLIKVTVGESVQFKCESEYEVIWSFKGNILPQNARAGTVHETNIHWLMIDNIQPDNDGQYTCSTENDTLQYISNGHLSVFGMFLIILSW